MSIRSAVTLHNSTPLLQNYISFNFPSWTRVHIFNPFAIFTSDPAPCRLMLSRLHGKQNLWWGTDGHCTKWVSSSRSWHRVHLRVAAVGAAGATPSAGATSVVPSAPAADSLDVTVVDDTCLEPDDRLPLELAETIEKTCLWLLTWRLEIYNLNLLSLKWCRNILSNLFGHFFNLTILFFNV